MRPRIENIAVRAGFLLLALVGVSVSAETPIRIAVFKGDGVGPSVNQLLSALDVAGGSIQVSRMTAEQIRQGNLADIDVLVHPGGSGSRQGKALGEEGRKLVRDFVRNGGGFLGVCAGSYLATNDYTWALHLIDAKVVDRRHWARGKGMVEITLSPTARSFFGQESEQVELYYGQGPLLGRREWDDKNVPDYDSLAVYKTGIAEKGAPAGVMPGTSAIVRTRFGDGRVFCFSPHPETTKGQEQMIATAARWLANRVDEDAVEIAEVSRLVRKHVPENSPGGVAVLVTRDGNVLHRCGYGVKNGRPITSRTELRLASVTKQFAAMCAAMLIEEGRLDLNASVSQYLPNLKLPFQGRELRVKDLLWHTSGLANFIQAAEKESIARFKRRQRLEFLNNETHAQWLATMPLRRDPGIEFEYTNSGYVLLTRIIEVIVRDSFHDFQKRRLFDVLDMQDTTDSTRFNGSGNMASTLVDYTKWDRALWQRDSRLLSPAGYDMIFTQGKFDNGDPIDYGFGWRLEYRNGKMLSAEHGGLGSGPTAARNLVRRHVNDRTTVAIFAQEHPQLDRNDRAEMVNEIYEWFLRN